MTLKNCFYLSDKYGLNQEESRLLSSARAGKLEKLQICQEDKRKEREQKTRLSFVQVSRQRREHSAPGIKPIQAPFFYSMSLCLFTSCVCVCVCVCPCFPGCIKIIIPALTQGLVRLSDRQRLVLGYLIWVGVQRTLLLGLLTQEKVPQAFGSTSSQSCCIYHWA
jgi:hypothetical protein